MDFFINLLYTVVLGFIKISECIYSLFLRLQGRGLRSALLTHLSQANVDINKKTQGSKPGKAGAITIYNQDFYRRFALNPPLGLGETYVEGLWDSDSVDVFLTKILEYGLYMKMTCWWQHVLNYLNYNLFNNQSQEKAWETAGHYDTGNELFALELGSNMAYSCGYWANAANLEQAQQHNMELIGRKLMLKPGMRVLDIGCGYGSLCKYLADKYHVQVVGITISEESASKAREICEGSEVEIRVQDYRDDVQDEEFDRIVCIEMIEHVGLKNYKRFFELTRRSLSKHGLLLLQVTGVDSSSLPNVDPWTHKHELPNLMVPSHTDISNSIHGLFYIEDWHSFGEDYDRTHMAWHDNFVRNWPKVQEQQQFEDPQKFYRTWTFSLLLGAALFRSRKMHVWQIVLSKDGVPGNYLSVR